MPRYDLYCPECGKTFERTLTFEEKDEYGDTYRSLCMETGNDVDCTFVINPSPVHYKGMGWFSTDHVDSLERHARNHYDGSGRNSDVKLRDRIQKHAS